MRRGCYNNASVNEQCCILWSHEWGGFCVHSLVLTIVLYICCDWIIWLAISYRNQQFSQTFNLVDIWLHWKNEAPQFPKFISLICEVVIIKVNITVSISQVLKFINSEPPKVWVKLVFWMLGVLRIGCSAFLLRAMLSLNIFFSNVHTAFGMISGF